MIIVRCSEQGKAACLLAARRAGKKLSEWIREAIARAEKSQRVLPREKWCSRCGMRPLTAATFDQDCDRCTKAQEELRR